MHLKYFPEFQQYLFPKKNNLHNIHHFHFKYA